MGRRGEEGGEVITRKNEERNVDRGGYKESGCGTFVVGTGGNGIMGIPE